jgi:Flp pilus assembly protein CpaB
MRVISVEISPETAAGGFILLNAHVDVIRSHRDKMAEKSAGFEDHTSKDILYNVRAVQRARAGDRSDGRGEEWPTRGRRQNGNGAGASPAETLALSRLRRKR